MSWERRLQDQITALEGRCERVESELRIWAEDRARRGWGPAFIPPYQWHDENGEHR